MLCNGPSIKQKHGLRCKCMPCRQCAEDEDAVGMRVRMRTRIRVRMRMGMMGMR